MRPLAGRDGRPFLCSLLPMVAPPLLPGGRETILARPRLGGTGGGAVWWFLSEVLTVVPSPSLLSPAPTELVTRITGCSLRASREEVSVETDSGVCRPQGESLSETVSTTSADSANSSLIESLEVYLVAVLMWG